MADDGIKNLLKGTVNSIGNGVIGGLAGAATDRINSEAAGVIGNALGVPIRINSGTEIQGFGGQRVRIDSSVQSQAGVNDPQLRGLNGGYQYLRPGQQAGVQGNYAASPEGATFVAAMRDANLGKPGAREFAVKYADEHFRQANGSIKLPIGSYNTGLTTNTGQPVMLNFDASDSYQNAEQAVGKISQIAAQAGIGKVAFPQAAPPVIVNPAPAPVVPPAAAGPQSAAPQSAPAPAPVAAAPVPEAKPEPVKFSANIPASDGVPAKIYAKNKDGQSFNPADAPKISANQVKELQRLIGAKDDGLYGPETNAKLAALGVNPKDIDFTSPDNAGMKAVLAKLNEKHGATQLAGAGQAAPAAAAPAAAPAAAAPAPAVAAAPAPEAAPAAAPAPTAQAPVSTAPREIGESPLRHEVLQQAAKLLKIQGSDQDIIVGLKGSLRTQPGVTAGDKFNAGDLAAVLQYVDDNIGVQIAATVKAPELSKAVEALAKQEGIAKVDGKYVDTKAAAVAVAGQAAPAAAPASVPAVVAEAEKTQIIAGFSESAPAAAGYGSRANAALEAPAAPVVSPAAVATMQHYGITAENGFTILPTAGDAPAKAYGSRANAALEAPAAGYGSRANAALEAASAELKAGNAQALGAAAPVVSDAEKAQISNLFSDLGFAAQGQASAAPAPVQQQQQAKENQPVQKTEEQMVRESTQASVSLPDGPQAGLPNMKGGQSASQVMSA